MARPRKAVEKKAAQGTLRKDRMQSGLSASSFSELPKPPSGLMAKGKKVWNTVVKNFESMGVLNELDFPTLENYCQYEELKHQAFMQAKADFKKAKEDGTNAFFMKLTSDGGGTYLKENPIFITFNQLTKHSLDLAKELAVNPKSRSQINFPKPSEEDEFDRYLNGEIIVDFSEDVESYVESIQSGEKPACRTVKAAVKRYLDDLERAKTKDFLYEFNRQKANYFLTFARFNNFVEGSVAGQKVRFEPWQAFIYWNIYGWVRKDNGKRRFTRSFVAVPRKNNKTTLSSVQCNYHLFADGEKGAQVFLGASSREQAMIGFSHARKMILESPVLEKRTDVLKESLFVDATNSRMKPLHADSGRLSGFNPSLAIIDEYHEHPNDGVYVKMWSGMTAREQPLIHVITTAGDNMDSACHEMWQGARELLNGTVKDDTFFAIIFELDDPDKWEDPTLWEMVNPNWGESIRPDIFKELYQEAKTFPSKKVSFLQLNLNVWTMGGLPWLSLDVWKNCGRVLPWEYFATDSLYLGVDLAERDDLCAFVFIKKEENGGLAAKPLYFMPAGKVDKKTRDTNLPYRKWVDDGHIIAIGDQVLNFDEVLDYIFVEVIQHYDLFVNHAEFDKHQAEQMMLAFQRRGIKTDHTTQSHRNFNDPTQRVEGNIIEGKFIHDNNPVTDWQLGNVNISVNANNYVKLIRKNNKSKKDYFDALITGLCGMKKAEDDPDRGAPDTTVHTIDVF